jgi:hypothetical protein
MDASDKTLPFLTFETKAADSALTLVLSWKTVQLHFDLQRMAYWATLSIAQTAYHRKVE